MKGRTRKKKPALEERAGSVRRWLDLFAEPAYKFEILKKAPGGLSLTSTQRQALAALRVALADDKVLWDGPTIHGVIHAVRAEQNIEPKDLFQPLYQLFLGRNSGPQVGWFLSTMDRAFVLQRLTDYQSSSQP